MVKEEKESEVIEHGDIFFYRPKVDTKEVQHIEDVQRFYMIISPVGAGKRHSNKNIYRLFIVGQKQLQALGIFMIVWRR